jgi:hypothetical protein
VLDLVRGQLQTWVEVRPEPAPVGLLVACTPTFFSWVFGTMLGRAVLALRASKRRGVVAVRAFEREGIVVLEVEGTVSETAAELDAATELPDPSARGERDLEAVGKALREIGGDLLLDADGAWRLARAFLPVASPGTSIEPPLTARRQRVGSRTSN